MFQKYLQSTLDGNTTESESMEIQGSKNEEFGAQEPSFDRLKNPFYILGGYSEINSTYQRRFSYDKPIYGLYNDDDYCEKVDAYNLAHPENMLEQRNFFTDFFEGSTKFIF